MVVFANDVDEAQVDLQASEVMTPLHVACQEGPTEVVGTLLSGGAKVDMQAKAVSSPLHTACSHDHMGVVRALLSAGAKVNLQNSWSHGQPADQGWCVTPAQSMPRRPRGCGPHLAIQGGQGRTADQGWSVTPACGNPGRPHANVNLQDKDGVSPLHVVSLAGHMDVVRALLSGGANVNTEQGWPVTPARTWQRVFAT